MQASLEKFPMNQARGHRIQTRENPGNKSLVGRPTVVVLGAGFAGLWAARALADGPVNVILIDRYNHHTFFPLLYQVATAELEPGAIAQPLRKIFWNKSSVHFYLGEVVDINFSAKIVRLPDHEIPYDYLVVALGSKPNYYGIPGAADYAFPLKSLEHGVLLRNQILSSFERAAGEENSEARQSKLTFTIVGGGPTGVAFAGTLTELIKGSLSRDFPNLDFKKVRVLLIEAADCLIPDMPKHLSDYTEARLQKMGVDVHLKSQVVKITPREVFLKDGTRIASQTVIWTAGVHGNIPGDGWGLATNRHNQVDVLPTLQVPGYPEAYVVGDLAGIKQDGEPLPMVSQVGVQTGSAAAKNILRQVAGRTPSPFRYHDQGAIDVIGRNAAVARMWGVSFSGFVAWVIWAVLHIYRLIGFRNRLILMINWAWDYLFREHGVRLIVPSEASLSQVANATGSSEQADIFAGVNHPQEMERKWFSQATKE